jgi:tetratricopeptide (TPR) repeat protein
MQEVAAEPGFVTWRQGRSVPYGEGVGFSALAEMVKAEAGILDGDPIEESDAKLVRSVEGAEDVDWLLRHLRPLVGVDGEAGAASDRSERFAAWRHFLESLAEEQPAVLVFEDVHWADDALLDFLDHLVDWASGVAMLVLTTARPEFLERRVAWGGGKLNAATLSLSPLAQAETAQLFSSLVDASLLEASDQAGLVARVGGNPLYAEQYARLLAERRSGELDVPENVEGIIAARLDALPPNEKQLLHDAAVFGKVFWTDAVAALGAADKGNVSEGLHALERKDFVQRARRSSVAGSDEYSFSHVLVRDVAYGQVPRAERGDKHRLAAEWLESLASDDHAAMVAHHWSTALDLARASGQPAEALTERARVALVAAGDRASTLNAFALAVAHYGAVLELTPSEGPGRPQLLLRLGRARWLADETGSEELELARDELLRACDRSGAAEAEVLLAGLARSRGDRTSEEMHLGAATSVLEDTPISSTKALVLSEVARSHMLDGAFTQALAISREALQAADELGLDQVRASTLNTRGVARFAVGDREGVADLEESLELSLRISSLYDVQRAYNNLASAAGADDARVGLDYALEALRVAEKAGAEPYLRFIRGNLPSSYASIGDWDEALRIAEEFIAEVDAGRPHAHESGCRSTRALIRSARGDVAGALSDAERVVEINRNSAINLGRIANLGQYACLLIDVGRSEEAAAVFDEILTLGRDLESPDEFHGLELGIAARALGRSDELLDLVDRVAGDAIRLRGVAAVERYARGDFVGAARLGAESGNVRQEALARLAAGKAFSEQGRLAEADEQFTKALAFFRSVGATRYSSEIESFLAATT